MEPLAERMRPKTIGDVVGQEHILGKDKILRSMIENKRIMNMIFYGPPGVGKTTVANIISGSIDKKLYKLNATNASVKDIYNIVRNLDGFMGYKGVVLYLDEIQNFNRKQQQALLEYIEDGRLTLIASTAENPYHCVYNAILSRSIVFEFKPVENDNIIKTLNRIIDVIKCEDGMEINAEEGTLEYIATMCGGDLRRAINFLEAVIYSTKFIKGKYISLELYRVKQCLQEKAFNFDKKGDYFYDALSALQKSIRGSSPDASIYYAALLIKGGKLSDICRRLLVIASEDIGLAYPQASSIVYSLVKSALYLGLPEARIPISQAVILLATAPKSNSCYKAIDMALRDIDSKDIGDIPSHLKNSHYYESQELDRGDGYKYPHDYKNNYVWQQYMPDKLENTKYYIPGENKMEKSAENYMNFIKRVENQ
ncbi:replication-associated recombination protein A [Clostridium sp. WILCCON 0269]|uniref:Replication-associated recombination protein A n=1 Tax=Candidatus Clostridium eludens TaxID=3381663 RepID=A0ABW8SMR1_9CLOT